jgi:hypothetical protein
MALQNASRPQAGDDSGLVFTGLTGKPVDPSGRPSGLAATVAEGRRAGGSSA